MKTSPARISQILFLAVFVVLFVMTEYRGKDEISVAVNSFFRADPLVVASYVLATGGFTMLLLPGLLLTVFTAALGRFFCGWICPLGTILDLVTRKIRKVGALPLLKGRFKYYFLFTLLFMSLFSINVAGVFDPIAILIRALTFLIYPLFGETVRQGWVGLYGLIGDKRDALDFIYAFVRDTILPFRETFYPLAFLSLAILVGIIALERYETRNWCRNLCPLGTLLGLIGRLSPIQRIPRRLCADCGECRTHCPTAFDSEILQKQDCVMCMQCSLKCAYGRAKFRLSGFRGAGEKDGAGPPVGRREVLVSLGSGFVLARAFSFTDHTKSERLLRPPGVRDEREFIGKCVRCGECMKVCIKNALYPATLEAGLYGIFSPVLIPRQGYCEYNCTLCGQVCPTGAIPRLPVEIKKKELIGLAVLDTNHCLPFAKKIQCIVCEEHCPIPRKAIRFEVVTETDFRGRTITLKKPYVVDDLCNGCGICEYVCPLEGKSAIEIFNRKGVMPGTGYGSAYPES